MLFVNIALMNALLTSMALSWSAVLFVLSVTLHNAFIVGRLIMDDYCNFCVGSSLDPLPGFFLKVLSHPRIQKPNLCL